MPAERTRGSKRSAAKVVQVSDPTPVDMSMSQGIAFAPNITPGTFHDPPPPDASESMLFPATDLLPTRRAGHTKKKPENHIPRPPNAFILFRSSFIKNQHVSSEVETNHSTLSKIIGLTWQNLPHVERQVWYAKAKAALDAHHRKWPQYSFRPLHTKGKGTASEKRKVREVGPKDIKRCTKIAELLVEGKKGAELDAAIQEFDRHHVPEVITRFEAPITARTYRRSSSAPADAEPSSTPFFQQPESRPVKFRAASSQPATPSSLSDGDALTYNWDESEAESYFDAPSSPSPLSSQSRTLPPGDTFFDLNTFSFTNASNILPVAPCSPLSISPFSSVDPFSQDCHTPLRTSSNMFSSSTSLEIDTSFLDTWANGSSPLCTEPSTPQSYSAMDNPFHVQNSHGNNAPLLMDHFDPTFNFLSDIPPYSDASSPMCGTPVEEIPYSHAGFETSPKTEFSSFYESNLFINDSLSASYATPLSDFAM